MFIFKMIIKSHGLRRPLNYLINSGEDPLKGYQMATKKEIFETVSKEVGAVCTKFNVPANVKAELESIIEANLAPKAGGATVNVDEVTKKDANGKVTQILCSVSGKWLPATKEFFYEDKVGKGIADTGLKRLSRQAESIRKQYIKTLTATEKAIMADVLDGKMTPEQGKAKLEKAKATKPDYSSVTATPAKEAE